ncbi:MAG: beta-ketoacyl synthase N-terminal-like domain-containing protein, partial [Cyanobacteria bacterium P01_E01_bin.34]
MPPYHDMGLIGGILQPVYLGIPVILMPPEAFLQKPMRWLQAISNYRACTSGGPNFAYDYCVRRISSENVVQLDLGCWELAFNGAEPIQAGTLDRFARKFAPAGFRSAAFYPCYGMAEATLFVTGSRRLQEPVSQNVEERALSYGHMVVTDKTSEIKSLVGCGHTAPGTRVEIVDPETNLPCAPDRVGEIWVAGPHLAKGYWQQPEQTEATFSSYLADETMAEADRGPFLRTGDLGILHDGELFVTGRLKTTLVIRGRNYYPQDIESVVQASCDDFRLGCGAAFGFTGVGGEEQLVIVQEVNRTALRSLDPEKSIGALREAVSATFDLTVSAVALLKPGSIPKTSSGKIQHYLCRERFLAQQLEPVAEWQLSSQTAVGSVELEALSSGQTRTPLDTASVSTTINPSSSISKRTHQDIQVWIVERIAQLTGEPIHSISLTTPLAHYGLNSVDAVMLSGELSDWLQLNLSPTLAYNHPTIARLAECLEGLVNEEGDTDPSRDFVLHSPDAEIAGQAGDESAPTEIAIIGIGCRFPGAANPDEFWELLKEERSAIAPVADLRWTIDDNLLSDLSSEQKEAIQWGGFIDGVDEFDPKFFGISPREAIDLDPQQRLLMEVTWEALEHASCIPEQLAGTSTGVFVGISSNDYARLNPNNCGPYVGTGNALSMTANRLSYILDLRGPSLAIDTACSSSLVAVHQATRSLRSQECNMAIVGGVNVMLTPNISIAFAQAGMLAADGRCKTFDASADGYVRGEGCGVVILKRLQDAQRDGDPIVSTIQGSAIVQDGRSNGLTAPNGPAQEATLRNALADAGLHPSAVDYVEAHGTGTKLGDPIEMEALDRVFADGHKESASCLVGSVKTNIGHLEAAAGIAGLIKVALALKHDCIPASLHLDELNPAIAALDSSTLQVVGQARSWKRNGRCRIAGVSSFGFGGTNCHALLAEAPSQQESTGTDRNHESDRPLHIFTLAAKSDNALRQMAREYATSLATRSD